MSSRLSNLSEFPRLSLQVLAHRLKAAARQNAEAAALLLDAVAAMPLSSVGRGVFTVSRALHIQRWDGDGWRTERLVDATESDTESNTEDFSTMHLRNTQQPQQNHHNTSKTVKE